MTKYLWLSHSSGGNLPPSLGVAHAFRKRGHEVVFATKPDTVARIEGEGFRGIGFKSAYTQVDKYTRCCGREQRGRGRRTTRRQHGRCDVPGGAGQRAVFWRADICILPHLPVASVGCVAGHHDKTGPVARSRWFRTAARHGNALESADPDDRHIRRSP